MKLLMTDRPVSGRSPPRDAAAVDLSALRIANCVGCFGCWTKTPGRCVIRDDAARVYPLIARSEQVLYVSRVKYGSYAPVMKTMLERGHSGAAGLSPASTTARLTTFSAPWSPRTR